MKRFFTSTIMFFMCCVFMSAATTVLFEGKQTLNWNDGVQIDGAKFEDAQVGDVIVVTTENGGFKLVANYPWTDLLESSEPTGSYTITTETLEAIKSKGIRVQGGEYVNLLKVELTSEAPQPAEKTVVATLLDTPATIVYWNPTVEVAGSLFAEAGVKEGDFVRINYTTKGDAQIQLCANSPNWHNILDCTDLSASKTVFDLKLTAQMITDIEADKLYIQGKKAQLSEIIHSTTK